MSTPAQTKTRREGKDLDINPMQDLGFMVNRSFADPDGHLWEAVWMDPAAIPPAA